MTDVAIPSAIPILASGNHPESARQLCAMEAAAWLAAEKHSDRPECVHPTIAELGRRCNDLSQDDERQLLWPLIIRSLGTADAVVLEDHVLSVRLALICAWDVLPIFEAYYRKDSRPRTAIEAAEAWCAQPDDANASRAMEAADAVHAANAKHVWSAALIVNQARAYTGAYAAANAAANAAHAVHNIVHSANTAANAAQAVACASAAPGRAVRRVWERLIDGYDEITGRNEYVSPDAAAWARVLVAGGVREGDWSHAVDVDVTWAEEVGEW